MNVTRSFGFRGGFTLVELLVVMAIVGVLVATLLPAMGNAKEHAWTIKCAANQHSLGTALANYGADNKGMLPIRIDHNAATPYAVAVVNPVWVYNTSDWYMIYRGYLLPENALGTISTTNWDNQRNIYQLGLKAPVFNCPKADQRISSFFGPSNTTWVSTGKRSVFNYLFNCYNNATQGINVNNQPATNAQNRRTRRLDEMPRNQMVLTEHLIGQTWFTNQSGPSAGAPYTPSAMNGLRWNFLWSVGTATAPSTTYAVGVHHQEGANVLMPGSEVRRAPAKLLYPNYPRYTAISDRINFVN